MPTLVLPITDTADDCRARADGGTFSATSTTLNMASGHIICFRFRAVTVPPAATVTAVVLRTVSANSKNTGSNADVHGHAADDSPVIVDGPDVISRAMTTATVAHLWDSTTTGQVLHRDVTGPVAEVLARPGWAAGNNLTVMLTTTGNSGGLANHVMRDYSGSTAEAAQLSIDYTEGAAPVGRPGAFLPFFG